MHELQHKILEFAAARDWERFHNPKDLALSIAIEAAELLEVFQWKNQEEELSEADKQSIASELADICHYMLLLCAKTDIDLEAAIRTKLEVNELRFPVASSKGIARPVDQNKANG